MDLHELDGHAVYADTTYAELAELDGAQLPVRVMCTLGLVTDTFLGETCTLRGFILSCRDPSTGDYRRRRRNGTINQY